MRCLHAELIHVAASLPLSVPAARSPTTGARHAALLSGRKVCPASQIAQAAKSIKPARFSRADTSTARKLPPLFRREGRHVSHGDDRGGRSDRRWAAWWPCCRPRSRRGGGVGVYAGARTRRGDAARAGAGTDSGAERHVAGTLVARTAAGGLHVPPPTAPPATSPPAVHGPLHRPLVAAGDQAFTGRRLWPQSARRTPSVTSQFEASTEAISQEYTPAPAEVDAAG